MHAMRYVLAGLFFVAGCGGDGSEPTPSQVPVVIFNDGTLTATPPE
jgi:hypothetical protein